MSSPAGSWRPGLLSPRFAYPRLDQATVRHFAHLMETGQFAPVIDRQYPLDQIVDAYRYAETGQKIGNVVITVAPSG
jgi:NADPH:quinone reductase-like Zn-dependent oxidoreductase